MGTTNRIPLALVAFGCCAFGATGAFGTESKFEQSCIPISVEQAPAWDWDDQDSYRVLPLDDSGKRFRVVGDILNITANKFSSIVAGRNAPNSKITEVIFDARQINFDASLPFGSARILFFAQKIRIGPNAIITLADAPTANSAKSEDLLVPAHDGVTFAARDIQFDHPKLQFLDFRTSEAAGRGVIAIAERVTLINDQLTNKELNETQTEGALKLATLDNFLGVPEANRSYGVTVGAAAKPALSSIAHKFMLWPEAFTTKLVVAHARAAYDQKWAAALQNEIAIARETIEQWGSAAAIASINRTQQLLDSRLDPYGRNASYVPIDDVKFLRNALNKALLDLQNSSGYVQAIEQTIIDTLKNTNIDETKLSKIQENITLQAAKIQQASENQIAADNNAGLAGQKYDAALNTVKQLRESIREYVEQQNAERRAGAKNLLRANYVALAASLIPGGSWFGISAQVWGQINSGQFSDGKFTVPVLQQTFEDIYSRQKDYNDAADALRKEWKKADGIYAARQRVAAGDKAGAWQALNGEGSPPPGWEPPSQSALLIEFAKAIHTVSNAANDLSKKVQPPHVLEVKETDAEAQNEQFQTALASAEEANSALTQAHEDAKNATEAYINATTLLEALEENQQNILGRIPINDLELSIKRTLAENLLRQQYSDIFREAVDLRRAAIYANGKPIDLDYRLNYFFDDALSQQIAFNAYSEFVPSTLNEIRTKTETALRALLSAADREGTEYARRLRDDGLSEFGPVTFRTGATESAGARFINEINENIARQIKFGAAPLLFPVPIVWQQSYDQHPRRFVDAVVTGVKLKKGLTLKGKSLNFRVVHPGYGTINLDSSCRIIDTRVPSQDNTTSRRTAFVEGRPSETYDRVSAQFLLKVGAGDFKYAALPLRTQYQLEVAVVGDRSANDWNDIPEIGQLSISFATVQ